MIVGGKEFVWAAYGVTWGGLILYGLSLWRRLKSSRCAAENFKRQDES